MDGFSLQIICSFGKSHIYFHAGWLANVNVTASLGSAECPVQCVFCIELSGIAANSY